MADDGILVGGGGQDYAEPRNLLLRYANRHGLITGATGTGKTVTLQILAEGFSAAGRAGGDPGREGRRLGAVAARRSRGQGRRGAQEARRRRSGWPASPTAPIRWCSGTSSGRSGHPVRTTVTEMGPLLLGADDGALRGAGGGAQHRLPGRRRAGAGAARPQGPAGDAGLARRERRGGRPDLRQRRRRLGRRDPARAPGPGEPGRGGVPRRAGAGAQGPDRARTAAWAGSTC